MHLGRLSSKVIGSKIWSQDISEEMKFILLCSFSKTIPKWPVILPKVLLIFIWYAVNYLYYCFEYFFGFYIFYLSVAYLLPHQLLIPPYLVYRHAYVVFIFGSLAALLQNLPLNKSPGPDCISAEHLLYADESLRFFLSELFNMCIVHGYIPNSCLNTTIVPICKNKNGNMSDTSNYRPVAVATVVSKLLEHFILSNISPFLGTTISLVSRLVIVPINVHFC